MMIKIFLFSLVIFISGCATFTEGWVYSEKSQRYLSNNEIKKLIIGNTVIHDNSSKTIEYFHNNGIRYVYYKKDEDYHNSNWCIVENKLCIDNPAFKLNCPKIKILKNQTIEYSREKDGVIFKVNNLIEIKKGDIYKIKQTYDEEGWKIHETKNCKN